MIVSIIPPHPALSLKGEGKKTCSPRPSGERVRVRGYSPRPSGERVRVRGYSPRPFGERVRVRGYFPRPFGERVRVRGYWSQKLSYSLKNACRILQDVIIPKANNPEPSRFEKPGSFAIIGNGAGMLATINFNNEFFLNRRKVNDINPDGKLSPEFNIGKPPVAQFPPETPFSISHILTQLTRSLFYDIILNHRIAPAPAYM